MEITSSKKSDQVLLFTVFILSFYYSSDCKVVHVAHSPVPCTYDGEFSKSSRVAPLARPSPVVKQAHTLIHGLTRHGRALDLDDADADFVHAAPRLRVPDRQQPERLEVRRPRIVVKQKRKRHLVSGQVDRLVDARLADLTAPLGSAGRSRGLVDRTAGIAIS